MDFEHDRDNDSAEREILFDTDVVRAGDGEKNLCSGVHVGAVAAAVRLKEDVSVASRRQG